MGPREWLIRPCTQTAKRLEPKLQLVLRFCQPNVRSDTVVRTADLACTCLVGAGRSLEVAEQCSSVPGCASSISLAGRALYFCSASGAARVLQLSAQPGGRRPSLVRRSPYTESVGSRVLRGAVAYGDVLSFVSSGRDAAVCCCNRGPTDWLHGLSLSAKRGAAGAAAARFRP